MPCTDLAEVFSKTKASKLPDSPRDCSTDLLSGDIHCLFLKPWKNISPNNIRDGNEWMIAFITNNRHYESLVMPYGLVSAALCSKPSSIKKFFEFLHSCVIIYLNDILIYSTFEKRTHKTHKSNSKKPA